MGKGHAFAGWPTGPGMLQVQQELGLKIHPWQESIIDMATTLIQRGIAKPVSK